jgi:hypothetical protein
LEYYEKFAPQFPNNLKNFHANFFENLKISIDHKLKSLSSLENHPHNNLTSLLSSMPPSGPSTSRHLPINTIKYTKTKNQRIKSPIAFSLEDATFAHL